MDYRLNINSPGGETDNAFETAELVARVAAQKPVFAVADTSAFSAAYLLASQAEKIYVAPNQRRRGQYWRVLRSLRSFRLPRAAGHYGKPHLSG